MKRIFNTRHSRIVGGVIASAVAALTLAACGGTGGNSTQNAANRQETQAQANDQYTLEQAQPVPHYDWSQIRQTEIAAQDAEAGTVQTTSFFFQQGMDHPYLICNSIGFPVPADAELTNPNQIAPGTVDIYRGATGAVIGQMDPNGIYTGQSAGTFVLCVTPDGKAEMQYAEPNVHTVGGPAGWDPVKKMIVFTGAPTVSPKIGKNG